MHGSSLLQPGESRIIFLKDWYSQVFLCMYLQCLHKKGRQILVSNFLRIRKQFGAGWFLVHLFFYLVEIPFFFLLVLFRTINIYKTFGKQNSGNFVMLLPLGIYLPLLYKKLRRPVSFFVVTVICFLTSVGIELLQLATSYRSTDVDDVVLNTAGACCGFIIYQLLRLLITDGVKRSPE